ncbi:nuclear transport factor 2 family protein, partial [Methylobacterium frigidaeris]
MNEEDVNVSLLRSAYAEWSSSKAANPQCWMELMADDAKLRSLTDGAPELSFTARRTSKGEIKAYLDDLLRDWEMVHAHMGEYLAQGDRVVVLGDVAWRNRATGKIAETRKVDVWRFRDGKAIGYEEFFDTAGAIAAATPDAAAGPAGVD